MNSYPERRGSHLPTVKVRIPRNATEGHKGFLSIDDWTVPCVVGRSGLISASQKREGDGHTPVGIFPLRYGLYNPSRWTPPLLALSFPFVPMTNEMAWEENPERATYNRLTITSGAPQRRNASIEQGQVPFSISWCPLVIMMPMLNLIGEAPFSFMSLGRK